MKKRIIVLLLIIIMLVAIIPTTAITHKGKYKKHEHVDLLSGAHVLIRASDGGKIYSPAGQYGATMAPYAVKIR